MRGPCVVIEVTSPSTARIDRGEKLDAYKQLPALRAYLIIDHRRRRVERHWREPAGGEWRRGEVLGEADTPIPVPCLDVSLTLDAIYRRVDLPAVHEPALSAYEPIEEDDEEDNGDEIVIAKNGKPLARLGPPPADKPDRSPGGWEGVAVTRRRCPANRRQRDSERRANSS